MTNARQRCKWFTAAVLLLLSSSFASSSDQPDVLKIVELSAAAIQADWQQEPNLNDVERDEDTKGGKTTSETYDAMMIYGSPYNHIIARNDVALSSEEAARQAQQLQEEEAKRANESPQERAARIAKYQKEWKRVFVLLRNLKGAFDFQMMGEERVEGHNVYVIRATPHPGYQADSRETKILTGMQGTLWIDKESYRWIRVEAEVIKTVWFGWFVAKVGPGTQFLLEQTPVQDPAQAGIWLPRHFRMTVNASVLWHRKDYTHDETYRDYRPISGPSALPQTITIQVNPN
jgi:hypothetical protein